MIGSTEFICVYNELFKFLHEEGGKEHVIAFWEGIREEFLTNLRDYIREDGLKGMYRYWSHTLGEEGGRHHMTLYDDMFVIDMHDCPSAKKVFRLGKAEPYPDYCEHCVWLYPPMIREFGYDCDFQIIDCEKGRCRLTVREREGQDTPGGGDAGS